MSEFERVAIKYFRDQVGAGMLQRIDGVACFSPLPTFRFWRVRLNWLVHKGTLIRRGVSSIWPSLDGMPAYGLSDTKDRQP